MHTRRNFLHSSIAAAAVTSGFVAHAQDKRPITILVGFAAGGSPDLVARTIAEKLQGKLGRPVIVDNKAGAGGQLALAALQNAPADGTTYALTPPGMLTIYPSLYPKLPYDVTKIQPVVAACTFEHGVVAGSGTPAKTLPEFLTWAKANPGKAFYGIPAAGTAPHFVGMILGRSSGVNLQSVPYRGGPPMVADLLGGQVPLAVNVLSNFTEYHRSGKLRVLATSGKKRSPLLQDVPTLSELGFKQAEAEEWYAFVAKAGTPKAETEALAKAVREVVELRDVRTALLASGHNPSTLTAEDLTKDMAVSTRRWAELIKATGFKLEN